MDMEELNSEQIGTDMNGENQRKIMG